MANFLKSLFGGGDKKALPEEAEVYNGYTIQPAPQNVSGGWSTEGVISKEIGGELKSHHFIRADTCGDRDGAVQLTLTKARVLIDQAGDDIFNR